MLKPTGSLLVGLAFLLKTLISAGGIGEPVGFDINAPIESLREYSHSYKYA